jgi:two-component system cell cycle sensor histidine kinase/response regulator CckA
MKEKPLSILLVEDSPGDARLMREAFAEVDAERFRLTHVERLSEALKTLEQGGVDIVLLDLSLPDESGLRTVTRARAAAPDVPIVVLTGLNDEEFAIKAVREGAEDYLVKGQIGGALMVRSVRYAIERHRLMNDRKRAEEALLASQEYALNIINSSLDMIIAVDTQRRIVEFNPAAQKAFGYRLEEIYGKHISELYASQEEGAIIHRETMEQGYCVREVMNVRKTGEVFPCLLTACALRNARGEAVGFMGISRDFTERRRVEEALRMSEARFRSVAQSANDAIILADGEGSILFWNKGAQTIFGYREDEVIGKPLGIIMPEQYREAHKAGLERFKLTGESRILGRILELHGQRKDGTEFPLEVSLSTWTTREGVFFSSIIRDLTQRKELEERLRQSQKMQSIGLLAGGIAHDFNNILTVIAGYASLLCANKRLPLDAAEAAEQISNAAERAANLTQQLLTFSHRHLIQPLQLNLNEIVGNLAKMLQRIIGEDISLQFNAAQNLPLICADRAMMEQILMNLAVNSRDAMPEGGRLLVSTEAMEIGADDVLQNPEAAEGLFICLTVQDTGCGIAIENLPHLFEPFFTTKGVGKGTGLGLATVHGIVKQHQGWIQVSSNCGKGTTFRIFLPASTAVASAPADAAAAPNVRGGTETLLVVEDEPPLRELLRTILELQGYRVLEAEDATAALKIWRERKEPIHLLVTDMVLPEGMSGRDLAGTLQAENSGLKVIFTSGYSADIVKMETVLRPGRNFLQKPYHPQKLIQAVRETLDERKLTVAAEVSVAGCGVAP